jgi:hypothetical protein
VGSCPFLRSSLPPWNADLRTDLKRFDQGMPQKRVASLSPIARERVLVAVVAAQGVAVLPRTGYLVLKSLRSAALKNSSVLPCRHFYHFPELYHEPILQKAIIIMP